LKVSKIEFDFEFRSRSLVGVGSTFKIEFWLYTHHEIGATLNSSLS